MYKTAINLIFFTLLTFTISSCNKTTYINDDDMLLNLENDLKEKFGANTYYTDISIDLTKEEITNIDLTQTSSPESLKMAGWNFSDQEWNLVSEVSLKLNKGEIRDYMFQIDTNVNLEKINQLKQKIPVQEDFYISNIEILAPENGDKTSLVYSLQIQKTSSKQKLNFKFNNQGNLIPDYIDLFKYK